MTINYTGIKKGSHVEKCHILNKKVTLETKISVVDGQYIGPKVFLCLPIKQRMWATKK